jgi:hypothetical protein
VFYTFATPSPPSVGGVRTPRAVDLDAPFLDRSAVTFHLALDPRSLGSETDASAAFAHSLAPQVSRVPFLIAGPVSLTVACQALPSPWHPRTVVYPNLEKWLRPLIEALSGADRLLVSPSLVGSISVTTRTMQGDPEGMSVTLTYPPDRLLAKNPLRVASL